MTKLGLALLATVIFSALLSVLISWWLAPQESISKEPFDNFAQHGIVPAAYAVFALAVTLAAGTLSRRTALAVLVSVIVSLVSVLGLIGELRPHYMTPVEHVSTVTIPPSANQIFSTSRGIIIIDESDDLPVPDSLKISEQIPEGAWVVGRYYIDDSGNRTDYLPGNNSDTDYTVERVTCYHPSNRYWPFQGIESSIFLGASAMLLVIPVWMVKRRMR